MTRLPLPEPKKYFGVDAEPDFSYFTAGQMHAYAAAENAALTEQVRVLRWTFQDVFIGIGQGGSAHEISQRTTPIIRAALEATK